MRHGMLLLIASLLVACQPKVRDLAVPAVAPDTALALISANAAYFVFPVERTPARGDPMAVSGGPAHMWTVDWWPPYTREGKDPHGIWLIIDRDPVGGTHPALADQVKSVEPTVMTTCTECDGASRAVVDPAVTARVQDNRVMFTVSGPTAVARVFPLSVDSVRFVQSAHGRTHGETWVQVRTSPP